MKELANKYRLLFIAAFLFLLFIGTATDQPALADDDMITVSGKIVSIVYGPAIPFVKRRAEMVIENNKGEKHTVFVGHKTSYLPHRTPVNGDKVSISCIKQDGRLAGVTVTYK